ncbi:MULTISPECIES: hypothetical protein [Kribbella]|nr:MULTISPECIES: hypothetical protein [Kribbella]
MRSPTFGNDSPLAWKVAELPSADVLVNFGHCRNAAVSFRMRYNK